MAAVSRQNPAHLVWLPYSACLVFRPGCCYGVGYLVVGILECRRWLVGVVGTLLRRYQSQSVPPTISGISEIDRPCETGSRVTPSLVAVLLPRCFSKSSVRSTAAART